jgi:hypothetical protein
VNESASGKRVNGAAGWNRRVVKKRATNVIVVLRLIKKFLLLKNL